MKTILKNATRLLPTDEFTACEILIEENKIKK